GTLSGPLVGTLIIVWLSQQLQDFQQYRMLIFGPILTLLVIFYPRGIVGAVSSAYTKFKDKKELHRMTYINGEGSIKGEILSEKQVKEG
ncbi:MAG: branched-chain amino acid ABC transporter permease, partial [Bacillus sp. (in: firmicutes)]